MRWQLQTFLLPLIAFILSTAGHKRGIRRSSNRRVASDEVSLMKVVRRPECVFTSYESFVGRSKHSCPVIFLKGISVPAGKTLELVNLPKDTTIYFEGKTTFGFMEWKGPLIEANGTIHILGAKDNVFDCYGARWWDMLGSNGGKIKPRFMSAHNLTDSTIKNLTIRNSPAHVFSINYSTNLLLQDITLDNKAGNTEGGHNTDFCDIANSDHVRIRRVKVYNQDDCFAINSGTNIIFENSECWYGHGVSIGGVGIGKTLTDNTVDGVTISNVKIINSENGIRIKTIEGAKGMVKNVKFEHIILQDIFHRGIVIHQDYTNTDYLGTGFPTGGVPIEEVTLNDIKGTVTSEALQAYVLCYSDTSCFDWKWSNIHLTGGRRVQNCTHVPATAFC